MSAYGLMLRLSRADEQAPRRRVSAVILLKVRWFRWAGRIDRRIRKQRRRRMQRSLHIEPDKCTGCLQCEMACSYENYGMFNPAKSRIKVFEFHQTGAKVPYTCTQCDEA
jgi:NAD-dependent dihydropyrimidine dehydrogenase PreA subunit